MHTVEEVSALPGTRSWPLNPKSSFRFRASQHCSIHSLRQPLPRRNAPASGWSQGTDLPKQPSPDAASQFHEPASSSPGNFLLPCSVCFLLFFLVSCVASSFLPFSLWLLFCGTSLRWVSEFFIVRKAEHKAPFYMLRRRENNSFPLVLIDYLLGGSAPLSYFKFLKFFFLRL